MMGRSASLALCLLALAAPTVAAAQQVPPPPGDIVPPPPPGDTVPPPPPGDTVPPPPPGDTVPPPPPGGFAQPPAVATERSYTDVPPDRVFEPLVAQAEADLSRGLVALAVARAQIVAAQVPDATQTRQRAAAVLTYAGAIAATPQPVAPDLTWAPLVDAAERDSAGGYAMLALARLAAVLRNVPPGSALVARAQALWPVAAQRSVTAASGAPFGIAPITALAPLPERDPDKRTAGEMVELYIASSLYGMLTGGWLIVMSNADSTNLLGTLPLLTGTAAALAAYGLDNGEGMRRGVPTAISLGAWTGLFEGLWVLGAFESHVRDDATAFSLLWGGTSLGIGVGALVGYGLRPSIADSRFVGSAALWGMSLGGAAALIASPSDPDVAFQIVLASYNIAILGAALAAGPLEISSTRVLWLDLGFLGGAMVGSMIPALAAGGRRDIDERTAGVGIGVGMLGGLLLAWILSTPREPAADRPVTTTAFDSLVPFAMPSEHGGVVAGTYGRF